MIGQRLKELRINHNYSQREIGYYLNISHVAYGDYERNKSYPDIDTIKKLCNLYNISIDYLLNENLNDILIIPKKEFENLKNAIKNINFILENIDKNIINKDSNTIITGDIKGKNITIAKDYNKKINTGDIDGNNIKIGVNTPKK